MSGRNFGNPILHSPALNETINKRDAGYRTGSGLEKLAAVFELLCAGILTQIGVGRTFRTEGEGQYEHFNSLTLLSIVTQMSTTIRE